MIDVHDCILTILVASNRFLSVSSWTDRDGTWDLYFTVLYITKCHQKLHIVQINYCIIVSNI